jgi:hypothetical protein
MQIIWGKFNQRNTTRKSGMPEVIAASTDAAVPGKHGKGVLESAVKLRAAFRAAFRAVLAFLIGVVLDDQVRVIHTVEGGNGFASKSQSLSKHSF